jgi:hypothetical protein
MSKKLLYFKLRLILVQFFLSTLCYAQNLFLQECFEGGVTVVGKGGIGPISGTIDLEWEQSRQIRKTYALTYRIDRPIPKSFTVDSSSLYWNYDSQVGAEFEDGPVTHYFAVHIQEITASINLEDNTIVVEMDGTDLSSPDHINQGWWSIMFVILYESDLIQEEVCLGLYTASQPQISAQEYYIETPEFDEIKDIGFSIYAERVGQTPSDNSIIGINSFFLGEIGLGFLGGNELGSVQGHFNYQNGILTGLSDDLANDQVDGTDGLATINNYITPDPFQSFYFSNVEYDDIGANPHPAFFLTYTPDCAVLPDLGDIPRKFSFCRGDTVTLDVSNEYNLYSWSESAGLSDSTSSNPFCFADSSGWYTVKMWNEGEEGCSQTIPIFVEVNDIPTPAEFNVNPSSCPEPSGLIQAIDPAGRSPHRYRLDGELQSDNSSTNLAAGVYDYQISSAAGCIWDTMVTVGLNPLQEADFDPFPETGFSPLFVAFANTSTQATGFQWLIDGEPISQNEDLTYTFPDSGSFEVSLIAYRLEESCADTATFTLRVEPGVSVLMPNIFSPNNDGRNDALVAQMAGITSCRWGIYNRWGNEVSAGSAENGFESVEIWRPDSDIPAGQYTVVVIMEGLAGQVERLSFEVALVR